MLPSIFVFVDIAISQTKIRWIYLGIMFPIL